MLHNGYSAFIHLETAPGCLTQGSWLCILLLIRQWAPVPAQLLSGRPFYLQWDLALDLVFDWDALRIFVNRYVICPCKCLERQPMRVFSLQVFEPILVISILVVHELLKGEIVVCLNWAHSQAILAPRWLSCLILVWADSDTLLCVVDPLSLPIHDTVWIEVLEVSTLV